MRQKPSLTVQKIGLAIYLFCLAFGIYYSAKTTMALRADKSDIVAVLISDDSSSDDEDTKSKKKFGSRIFSEEDDDDSAREFCCDPVTFCRPAGFAPQSLISGYTPNSRNIITPPPRS